MRARRRLVARAAVLLILAGGVLAFWPKPPMSAGEIRKYAEGLNEVAAIQTPHHVLDRKGVRAAHLAMFEAVEAGRPLSAEDSAQYRRLYQSILKDRQAFLYRFDREMSVRTDLHMDRANNVGGMGIAGAHDHHDASAGANFAKLQAELSRVENARGLVAPFQRVLAATASHKNLTDIIEHLGTVPQTLSVPHGPMPAPRDAVEADYQALLAAFKRAQFAPVNSPAYYAAVRMALARYAAMAARVEARLQARLSPFEQALSGRWASWQSLASPIDPKMPVRPELRVI